ncbi:MAG TPA: F0F1 ATP synthase subunit A [Ruania sp.]|nr:F0F1 ATP synthase subunit A [Ruania sp.]
MDLGSWFGFDRIIFVRIILTALLLLLLWLGVRRAKLVPGRGQSIVELAVDFVRVQVAEQILGKERARPYVALLTTIFFTVLAMNLGGLIPGLNIAGTSRLGIALVLAVWVLLVYLSAGVRKHGFFGYIKSQLFPPGVPWPMYILLTPVELLQVLIIRPATLVIRLVANMMAGHIMMVLAIGATNFLLLEAAGALKAAGALTFVGGMFITVFELFVALLQAYIFAILSAVYLNFALEEEH